MSLSNSRTMQLLVATMAITSVYAVQAVAQEASASGEVRRIDSSAGKITLKHGAIADLNLPAMTLVYKCDPALMAGIKPGDKVRFKAKREDSQYVVTEISK